WNVERDHLLPERIPPLVAERGGQRVDAARHVRVDVAADEAELVDAALELLGAVARADPGRLRQLADRQELAGEHAEDARDEVVVDRGPVAAHRLVAEIMAHAGGTRREDDAVDAAILHLLQVALQRLRQQLVADLERALARLVLTRDLPAAIGVELRRRLRVMDMNVDDHRTLQSPDQPRPEARRPSSSA